MASLNPHLFPFNSQRAQDTSSGKEESLSSCGFGPRSVQGVCSHLPSGDLLLVSTGITQYTSHKHSELPRHNCRPWFSSKAIRKSFFSVNHNFFASFSFCWFIVFSDGCFASAAHDFTSSLPFASCAGLCTWTANKNDFRIFHSEKSWIVYWIVQISYAISTLHNQVDGWNTCSGSFNTGGSILHQKYWESPPFNSNPT